MPVAAWPLPLDEPHARNVHINCERFHPPNNAYGARTYAIEERFNV